MIAPITRGNKKLPRSYGIINLCPAKMCPSRALGMCQLDACGVGSARCYALKAERAWPKSVMPHRMAQMEWWDNSVGQLLFDFRAWRSGLRAKITAVRIGESGDFRHSVDVSKLTYLAKDNPDLAWYCYTARKDLFTPAVLNILPLNVVVNGSGWLAHNEFVVLDGLYKDVKTDYVCPGDCRKCSQCLKRGGLIIGVKLH
jgi:hypothetical protein